MKQTGAKTKSPKYNLRKTGSHISESDKSLHDLKEPFSFGFYAAFSGVFIGFLILQFGFLKIFLSEYNGVGYFFFLIALSFLVVAFIDSLVNKPDAK